MIVENAVVRRFVEETVQKEVLRQDKIHPPGFPPTRDGLRLGLAALEDELEETKQAHREERRMAHWNHTEEELVQVVAIGLRMLYGIEEDKWVED